MAFIAAAVCCTSAPPERDAASVATSAAGTVTCGDLRRIAAGLPPRLQLDTDPDGQDRLRRQWVERLVIERLLAAEAETTGVWQSDAVQKKWQIIRRSTLLEAVEKQLETAVTIERDEVERYYLEHRDRFTTRERVGTSLILLRLEPDAGESETTATENRLREIRQERIDGVPFGELARRYSEAENAARGGAVAASPRGTLLPAFEDVAWRLERGEVSGVVRLPDGLALIRVDAHFPERDWSLEEVTDVIFKRIQLAEIETTRDLILQEASARWPARIDWGAVFDPAVSAEKPVLFVASRSKSLGDLGLGDRPPRLRQAIEAALGEEWLVLWAEEHGLSEQYEVAADLEEQQRQLQAKIVFERKVAAALPAVSEIELEKAYDRSIRMLEEPEKRLFSVILVPGEQMRMRGALAEAQKIETDWRDPARSRSVGRLFRGDQSRRGRSAPRVHPCWPSPHSRWLPGRSARRCCSRNTE